MSHLHTASTEHCAACGGEVDGYKCPGCGKSSANFDHDHFRNCPKETKMKLKCKACGNAETECGC